jgi:hypothetical protein
MADAAPDVEDYRSRNERTRMSRQRLIASLPGNGSPGFTRFVRPGDRQDPPAWLSREAKDAFSTSAGESVTGSVLLEQPRGAMLIVPPFAVEEALEAQVIETARLIELLERPRAFAALLLRRGGYTVGFFRGEYLVASKTDRRFVKNRHRKGGQSQRRFDRIREKQVHEMLKKACEDGRATLEPYASEIQHLYFGGDRLAVKELREECEYFDRTYGSRISPRLLPVVGDPRRASLDGVAREVWMSDVWVFERG